MNANAIERDVVMIRVNGIEGEIAELAKFAAEPFETFTSGVSYKLELRGYNSSI